MGAKLYRNKYRIPSARLPNWDYRRSGWYFVTVVTFRRKPVFGFIKDGTVHFTPYGRMANDCWRQIPQRFAHVHVDEFVVMPDHVHGILALKPHEEVGEQAEMPRISDISPKKNSLSVVMRSYKSAVTRQMNLLRDTPGETLWQSRYYDRIIRTKQELSNVRRYIQQHPANVAKPIKSEIS